MSDISVKSINLENKQFILQVSNVPDVVKQYPVKVTAILENGEQITQTKMVTLKVTPTVSISGSDSFVAKNGSGTSNYVFVYEPEVYNVDVVVNSVVSSNSSVSVTSVSKNGFSLSVVDISADLSTAITASISIDGKETIVIKNITVTYKESRQPFILYNAGEDADVGIYRSSSNVKMTQMYYAVVDDFIAGEDYDDSNIEYQIYENNTTRTVTISTVKTGQALLLKAVEKNRLSSNSNDYCNFTMIKGRFNAYGEVGALDGFYTALDFCCYQNMFTGCASLTTAPELPATTLEMYCYSSMFSGCTSLTTAPELPATTLANSCYNSMFSGCTSLTTAPELPATALVSKCYSEMFHGCTGLTAAPELPATTLASGCYSSMFSGCTSLTTAPELPATTIAGNCYSSMFSGCTSLTTAPELPATTLAYYCYQNMFTGCASLTTAPELPATTAVFYCYYSMFTGCASLTTAPELPATTLSSYCYQDMFNGCTSLAAAPELPATTLAMCCYSNMFTGCASLTTAPELPATTLEMYCYSSMFSGCASLTTAPELPATTLATCCYKDMFDNCIGLTTAPELPATTLATGCYFGMLSRCNGIKTPPRLPVTELKTQCYAYMFYLNTGITTAPELPATTLASQCYSEMFHGCTSLTAAPELPATTLVENCYNSMFNGCSNLQYIKALFTTTPSTSYTKNWCNGVAASGVFIKNGIAEWDLVGVNGVPSGWEIRLNSTHVSWDSLSITADDVNGRKTSTIIHYTLIETMLDENGTNFQRTVTGNAESDTFEQNTSTTDSKTISISYTEPKSGLTATTTITQGVWVDQSYTVDLNSQWQESSTNPDSTLYDCYESFSNYHVSNANAIMYITIEGFTEFSLYIRSYAESSYDYVVVGNLDATSISRTTSNVKAHTSGNQNSGTSLSVYTKVTFSGLDGLEHKIPILYGKDGSSDSGTDKGYVIIEKNQ